MKNALKFGLTVAAVSLSACSSQPGPTVASAGQALTGTNGDGLNGDGLNGDGLNGDGLNGSALGNHLQFVDLSSAAKGSALFDSMGVQGSELVGALGGVAVAGADVVGATFTGTTVGGQTVSLAITGVQQEAAPNDDTWDYTVKYWDATAAAWTNLCQDATGAPVPAYALQGYWDYAFGTPTGGSKIHDAGKFVFACKGLAALGKCVGWGYAPWRTVNGVSLDAHHQACVRMVRADFCGEGVSYTKDGNAIDLYDGVGIQADTEAWVKEAEWDEHGARCFYAYNRSDTLSPVPTIPCYDASKENDCGDTAHFSTGTLVIDEIPAQ